MPEKVKRLPWLKFLLGGLLAILLLVVAFYQPILFGVAQVVAQQIAKSQELSLRFKIHGSIFSDLYVEDLHLRPLGQNTNAPLERVDAERVGLRYNLFSLLKKDFLNVVELLELKDVSVVIHQGPLPQQEAPTSLRTPAIIPRKIDIQDVNLIVRGETGDLEVQKFALAFQQGEEGYLACEALRIPHVGAWNQIRAGLRYDRGQLELTDFALEPLVAVNRLNVDLSGSEQGSYRLALDARVMEAAVVANVRYDQPADSPLLDATFKLTGLELSQIQRLSPIPISGSVSRMDLQLNGDLNRPKSFSGSIDLDANHLRYGEYGIDTAHVGLRIDKGSGKIQEVSVNAGPNRIRANGSFTLSGTPNQLLSGSTADLGFAAEVRGPDRYVPDLNATTAVSGFAGLANGRAQLVVHASAQDIRMPKSVPGLAISGFNTDLFAVAHFPLAGDPWKSVAAVAVSNVTNISYRDAHVGQVRVVAETTDTKTATANLRLRTGESRAEVTANLPLPSSAAPFDPNLIAGHLKFNIATVTDFISQDAIAGNLTANGDVRFDHLQADGAIRARGNQLKYRGMILQSLDLDAAFRKQRAQVRDFRINFDPANYLDLKGSAQLADPFPFQANGQVTFKDVAVLNEFLGNLGLQPGLSGGLHINFTGTGDVRKPTAQLQVSGNQLQYRGLLLQNVNAEATVANSKADLQTCRLTLDAKNHLELKGAAQLADPYPYELDGTIELTDIGVFDDLLKNLGQRGGLSGNLNGTFSSNGDVKHPAAHLQLSGDRLNYLGLLIPSLGVEAALEGGRADLKTCRVTINESDFIDVTGGIGLGAPFPYEARGAITLRDLRAFDQLLKNFGDPGDLSGSLSLNFSGNGDAKKPTAHLQVLGDELKYRGLQVQKVDIEAKVEDSLAIIETGKVNFDAANYIDLTGESGIVEPYDYKTNGEVELKNLAVFNELLKSKGQSPALSGNAHANWSVTGNVRDVIPDARLEVLARQVKYRGLVIQSVDIDGNLSQRKLDLPSCKVVFNQNNFIDARGDAVLDDPYDYDADAKIQFQDLGFLNELSKTFGQDLGLGGKLSASWTGKGPLKDQTGNLEIHGDQIQAKGVQRIKFEVTGNYQGMNAEIPRLQFSSPYADLDASMRFNPRLLEIPALNISKNGNKITGRIKIPLNLQAGAKVLLDLDGPVDLNLQADKISLGSFQPGKPQVTGTIAFQLQGSQTLRDPFLQLTASARDVRTTAASTLSAAQGDLSVRLAGKVLTVDGKIQQPDVHPLLVTGQVPLDVGNVIETGKLPEDTPLQFAIKWPDNNLGFIRKIVPDVKVVEGTTSVDVAVNGTIKRPDLSGEIRARLSRFQARTDTVPPIADFAATITFRRDHVQFDQLRGLAGGGLFGVNGAIDLTDGTNPKFNIGVTGNQVLLTRSDGIVVRANINLAIRGPLSSGEVSGTVGITDSRFFKDIDILPLNLPGRPPPQPPTAALPKIAVDTPPFRDWKFNISIRTDDAFLIQSNLARGRVTINLQAGGTGAAPAVTGFVQVDHLVASLPFSRMEITDGRIDFVQGGNILDPGLSILGRSTVGDYDVRMRIFGNVSNPTVLLDSSPPLAQGDILVLLATGATTSQFEQDPSLLAGRATFVVLQQVFRKFFPGTNQAEPFIDRFTVNVVPGTKAGEQNILSSFKLTKNWEIIGVFGTGSYQGRLKYLVRFR